VSFIAGSATFQRLFISGKPMHNPDDEFFRKLAARAFGRNAVASDAEQIGWIGGRHLLDTDIKPEHTVFGSFVHLAIRVDKLTIPPNLLKAYIRMEEDAVREVTGRDFLSKGERKKAKETAVLRAEQEAKTGAFRRSAAVPVLIDLANAYVLVGSSGSAVADRVMKLFSDTFGRSLEPATAEAIARRIMLGTKHPAALDNAAPFRLVDAPDGYEQGESAGVAGDLSFLGREMLSWLWHRADREDGRLAIRGGDELSVMIDRSLKLKCDFGLTGTTSIVADGPTSLPEARAALRIGKQPARAGLIIGGQLGEFRLTLDPARFAVGGLIVTEDQAEKDFRARIEQRFELIVDALHLLDGLFELYVTARTSREWPRELAAMSAWARGQSPLPRVTAAGA
jgi:Putative exonuclease, RdgC